MIQEKESRELSRCTPKSSQKSTNERVTDYALRAETISITLGNTGQTVDDVLIIAMIFKGLSRHFEPFYNYVTHSNKELTLSEFKTELHSFEETLKYRNHSSSDDVMKLTPSFSKTMKNDRYDGRDVSYFTCSGKGYLTKICPNKRLKPECNYCKSTTHKRKLFCYKRRETMKKVLDVEESSFAFKVDDT